MSRLVGGSEHDDLSQAVREFLPKGIADNDVAQRMPDQMIVGGLRFFRDEFDQLIRNLIQGIDRLVIGKVQRLVACRPEPLAQNHHGQPRAPLSMQQNDGFVLFHDFLPRLIRF